MLPVDMAERMCESSTLPPTPLEALLDIIETPSI